MARRRLRFNPPTPEEIGWKTLNAGILLTLIFIILLVLYMIFG